MNVWLYDTFIFFYQIGIRIAALFGNQKAKQWIDGRTNIFQKIKDVLFKGEQLVWFHCSSLGEFEQGHPVIEKLKTLNPELKIVLTFYSPSGYEVRKNYQGADFVCYLPSDTKGNAKQFVELLKPQAVYFVKYEYWHHYFH